MKSIVVVIGAGQMGQGIAQVCIQGGYQTYLIDANVAQLEKAKANIESSFKKFVEKQKISAQDVEKFIANLELIPNIESTPSNAFCVIEAVPEQLGIKEQIFQNCSNHFSDTTIISSNTSSFSISKLANFIRNPERFIGIHFMNPVPIMPLVEVIYGAQTDKKIIDQAIDFVKKIGKQDILVKDSPGFIVNRILIPMINEAVYLLQEQVASPEHIDKAMVLGANQPLGPLALADMIGIDTCLSIMQTLYHDFANDKYKPCPLMQDYVNSGKLGKKSGQGFYNYK